MSEIKVIFGAPTGCTSPKTVRPGISPKSVHPAVKMCAPGAGCTLNFRHCIIMFPKVG